MAATELIPALLSPGERSGILAQCIGDWVREGWRVESQGEYQVVIVHGRRPNHLLHLFLAVFTLGTWTIPWILIAILAGEKWKTITIDEVGNRLVR